MLSQGKKQYSVRICPYMIGSTLTIKRNRNLVPSDYLTMDDCDITSQIAVPLDAAHTRLDFNYGVSKWLDCSWFMEDKTQVLLWTVSCGLLAGYGCPCQIITCWKDHSCASLHPIQYWVSISIGLLHCVINAYMWYTVTASRIICLSVVFLVYTFRMMSSLLTAFLDNGSHLTCPIWYKHNGLTKGCPLYIHTDCDFSILSCSTSSPSNHRTTSLWWYMYTVSSYTRWNTFLLLFVLSARVFNSHHRKNEQI